MPHDYQDKSRGIRLQKAMADAGVASRRDCEQLVIEGRVTVNGDRVAALPAWVDPVQDRIAVDGRPLARPRATTSKGRPKQRTYLMLNKPRRVISTTDDPQGRTTVVDLLGDAIQARVFPVGRLDSESTGLILLTDDGELAARLTHPSHEVPKRYMVTVRGTFSDDQLQPLRDGLLLTRGEGKGPRGQEAKGSSGKKQKRTANDNKHPAPGSPGLLSPSQKVKRASVESVAIVGRETDRRSGDRTTLAVTLIEGQNREIRRLLARQGVKVRKLQRVAIGPVKLKGLAVGQWRRLTRTEVQMLRRVAGLA